MVKHEGLSLGGPCGPGRAGVLALWAVFVAVVRVLDVPVGGIQPEAFALTAMMTAPITLGAVLLVTLGDRWL